MKQIIPFQKEIAFRTMIGEITSISLEHTLVLEDENTIRGDFIVSGTYKMTEASQIEENFDYHLPVDIEIAEHYDIKNSHIEIDDFYYEIVNDDTLKVSIDVLLDGVEAELDSKIEVREEPAEEITVDETQLVERHEKDFNEEESIGEEMIENEIELPKAPVETFELQEEENVVSPVQPQSTVTTEEQPAPSLNSIFSCFKDSDETFSTYSVYIVREADTLDEIIDRYHTNREDLSSYNNLDEIKVGSKLIIPCNHSNT